MTPKEKAKDLVQRFREGIYKDFITDDFSTSTERIRTRRVKACALIAVDEILEEADTRDTWDSSRFMYFQQVKAEIEKL